jgi:hypothetical protein
VSQYVLLVDGWKKMTDEELKLKNILGSVSRVFKGDVVSMEEELEWDAWNYAFDKIKKEELAKFYDQAEEDLPVNDAGVVMPEDGEVVWVWNDEESDDLKIGWHQTTIHNTYGSGDNAYCNWWNEPIGGRCGRNPYWLPGDTRQEDLPDMDPLLSGIYDLAVEADVRARDRIPSCEGKRPSMTDLFSRAFEPIPLFDEEKRKAWEDRKNKRELEVRKRAEKYLSGSPGEKENE